MSTLSERRLDGTLFLYQTGLDGLPAVRWMYMTPTCKKVICEDLPSWTSQWGLTQTPAQQFDALMDQYLTGEAMDYNTDIKTLNPVTDNIWEMKTPDLRLFGWFYRKGVFIATALDLADRVKGWALYSGYRNDAVRIKSEIDLRLPKCIEGGKVNDVV